ncbi:serine hydrolase [Nocardiopsis ansamitocini]|uniref:Beta-lactamase class A catalytic domain-containing protein n=1 Tax=Nocardiopsis ansamitocini TaxID=1670832 RepID=A0A9W6P982_9ACTN|nr:serine hydrolase [Nocardiopsis ansamitocini]GLU49945.1 hypothetical protein Nans01_42960 [Nocardiopsis ansamitocini]
MLFGTTRTDTTTSRPDGRIAWKAACAGAGAVLLAGAAAPAAHADDEAGTGPGTVCVSETRPEAAALLSAVVEAVAKERAGDLAVGVTAYGGDLTCDYQAQKGFDAASVGKVLVLATLLRTAQEEGRALTPREDALATEMITVSDNDATVELRLQLGRERMQEFLDLAGMSGTVLHPDDFIGLMKITATDQLRLLDLVVSDNDVLGEEQRAYARSLMGGVVESQRWGVPAGAPEDARVHLKNGWLPYDGTDVWRVNSIGAFESPAAGSYRIAVLTDQNPGMAHGVESIELVAVAVHAALNGTSPSPGGSVFSGPGLLGTASDGSDRA